MEHMGKYKLTEEQKKSLKARLAAGAKLEDAAREFGVSKATVAYCKKKWGFTRQKGCIRCTACGNAKNLPGAKFCSWCGAPIKSERQTILEGLKALAGELDAKGMETGAAESAIRYIAGDGRE